MKKDVVIAIVIGFLLGSITAVTLIKMPELLKKSPAETAQVVPAENTITPGQISSQLPQISVNTPADFSILPNNKTTVSGKTNQGALVVAESALETFIQEASTSGEFSFEFGLTEGVNNLYLTSYNESGESKSLTLTLFYTTEKL